MAVCKHRTVVSVNAADALNFGLNPYIERQKENIYRSCPTAMNIEHHTIQDYWSGDIDVVITYESETSDD